jgi:protocatechuate 3,4-dioxygenase beta subunit
LEDATVTPVNAFNASETDQVRTDKRGDFKFRLIQPGQYVVYAVKPGFLASATTLELRNGARKSIDLVLDGLGRR